MSQLTAEQHETDQSGKTNSKRRRRLKLLILCGLLSIFVVLFYRHFWHNHDIGAGPASPSVDRSLFADRWSDQKVLLLGLGDSITDGFGASPGKSYFNRIIKNPEDEFDELKDVNLSKVLPNLEALNNALSGTTSIELLEHSLPRLEQQPIDTFGIVVVTIGGNDVIHNYGRTPPKEGAMYGATMHQAGPWFENFEVRLNRILDEIESRFPGGCEIFLANIYDPTDGAGDTINAGLPWWSDGLAVLGKYNQIIAKVCHQRDRVSMIDIHSEFLGHGIHCKKFWRKTYRSDDPHYWYFDNLEDPNDRGYDAIRRLYLNKIAEVVPKRLGKINHHAAISSTATGLN